MDDPGFHENRDRRGVFVPLWVVDAVDGDWPVAVLYAQLLWWHQTGLDGRHRARHERDGERWLLRADDEWSDECRLTVKQVRRAKTVLVERGLIEARRFKRSGAPTSAWRPIRPDPDLPLEGQIQGTTPGGANAFTPGGANPPSSETYQGELPDQSDADAVVVELCDYLASRVEDHRQLPSSPPVTKAWTKTMRLLLERGPTGVSKPYPVTPQRVRAAIDFTFDRLATPSSGGFCWADQIRSPGALRDKWFQLVDAGRRLEGPRMSRVDVGADVLARAIAESQAVTG